MSYSKFFKQSPNYTPASQVSSVWGRPRTFEAIAIHWWDDPARHPSFEGVIATLTNPTRQASAHYVAEKGRVAQLVREADASWATNSANPFTISIECNPRQLQGDYETIAELISDIWKRHGKLPLVPHRKYAQTTCPGTYSLSKLESLAEGYFAPKPPKLPADLVYEKLAKTTTFTTNASPTYLWDVTGSKWSDFKSVKTFSRGEDIDIYGKIIHPLGSVYLLTAYSFLNQTDTGFNQVDMLEKKAPVPPEPVENPVVPPVPPQNDSTDEDSVAGGDRIGKVEKQLGLIKLFLLKLRELINAIFGKTGDK